MFLLFLRVLYYIVNFEGQIAFAVFRVLFVITQLLCHVSALLTSIIITQVPVTFCTLLHRELEIIALDK